MQHVGEGVHQARLADAGNAFEQHVATRKQARHGIRDNFLVTDDTASDFGGNPAEPLDELVDVLGNGCGRQRFLRLPLMEVRQDYGFVAGDGPVGAGESGTASRTK